MAFIKALHDIQGFFRTHAKKAVSVSLKLGQIIKAWGCAFLWLFADILDNSGFALHLLKYFFCSFF